MAWKEGFSVPYDPLPPTPTQAVVVLTPYFPRRRFSFFRHFRCCLLFSAAILFLSAGIYFLYPSDPDIEVTRVRLNRIRVVESPRLALDLSFSLAIKVRNRNFFSFYYDSLVVSVGYRGRELGLVTSSGGRIPARGSSYIEATLDLNGLDVFHDVIYLIADLAKGVIPFDTVAWARGDLGLLFLGIPIQGKVSCEVYVNVNNQSISHQDCHPV